MNPTKYRRYTFPFAANSFTVEFPEWTGHQERLISRTYIETDNVDAVHYAIAIDFNGAERDRNQMIIRQAGFDNHAHYSGSFTGFMNNVARIQILNTGTMRPTDDTVRGWIEFDVLTDVDDAFTNVLYLLAR